MVTKALPHQADFESYYALVWEPNEDEIPQPRLALLDARLLGHDPTQQHQLVLRLDYAIDR